MARHRPRIAVVGMDRQVPTALGVGPHVTSRRQFSDLILAAGCLPIIIPPLAVGAAEYLEFVDALVIPGGYDLDPDMYGQELHEKASGVDSDRDRWEIALVRAALEKDRSVLGVCRGMQVLNVALGGTLSQHLPDEPHVRLAHQTREAPHQVVHEIFVTPGSRVAQALGLVPSPDVAGEQGKYVSMHVNSLHHQGIERLGVGLEVTATASDGVIEAVESAKHTFVVGVQWHPELLADPQQKGLFVALAAFQPEG